MWKINASFIDMDTKVCSNCKAEKPVSEFPKNNRVKEGMSWNNYGKWQIDHIIPVASAIDEEELYKLNQFTNLQPLWAEENNFKKAKYDPKDKEKFLKWYSKNVIS